MPKPGCVMLDALASPPLGHAADANNMEPLSSPALFTPLPDLAMLDPLQSLVQPVLPLPSASAAPVLLTPPTALDAAHYPSMDTIVGASVAPGPPKQLVAGLRLPSFEALGIANPHSSTSSSLHDTSHPSPVRLKPPFLHTLTPPDEQPPHMWAPSEPLPNLTLPSSRAASTDEPHAPRPSLVAGPITPLSTASDGAADAPRLGLQRTPSDNARSSWVKSAGDVVVKNVLASRHSGDGSDPIKVMSHALPCPSSSGFVFPFVISSLQLSTADSDPLCWINVFHALPGKFGLNDVPTSPPSTPDPPVGGRDYFTSMTFDSAVRVLDYQDNLTSMPRSPHPLVPPCTISLSIIERYIPPTSANEFTGMFSLGGRSLLIDRLVELSPNNGSLLLIYPTRAGADTFCRQYLSPVLDPLLRSMQTLQSLPREMISSLGAMSAVSFLPDFARLHASLLSLCAELARDDPRITRYAPTRSRFVVDLATTHSVVLDRPTWADAWWTKQEKTRIRNTVNRFAPRLPTDRLLNPTAIVHALLDGVVSRPYPGDVEPTAPIEVGVFVIRRIAVDE